MVEPIHLGMVLGAAVIGVLYAVVGMVSGGGRHGR